MNILIFSEDPQALVNGSDTQGRMREYARTLGQLYVIVRAAEHGRMAASGGLFLYPAAPRGVLGFLRAWRIGAMLCCAHRFDVISVQAPSLFGCIGFLLSRRFGTPFQLQLHTDYMNPWYRRAGWKERLHYALARVLVPQADCVRAVSERIRRSFQTKSGMDSRLSLKWKIAVLPIFTDTSRFLDAKADPETKRRLHDYDFKMIAVGRFVDREKNFFLLIDVMRLFVRICPASLLVIVGEGPDREGYESRIRDHGLEKNVILERWRDDLASFYKSFDLFLMSSDYEGWGRAVIEAMAAGLPIVMTDVGLAREIIKNGKNGLIVPVRDRAAFLAGIMRLYRNPGERARIASSARASAEEYAEKTKAQYLALYKKSFLMCCQKGN